MVVAQIRSFPDTARVLMRLRAARVEVIQVFGFFVYLSLHELVIRATSRVGKRSHDWQYPYPSEWYYQHLAIPTQVCPVRI